MNWINNPRASHPVRTRPGLAPGLCVMALLMLGFALPSLAVESDTETVDLVACNTGDIEIDTVNVGPGE